MLQSLIIPHNENDIELFVESVNSQPEWIDNRKSKMYVCRRNRITRKKSSVSFHILIQLTFGTRRVRCTNEIRYRHKMIYKTTHK